MKAMRNVFDILSRSNVLGSGAAMSGLLPPCLLLLCIGLFSIGSVTLVGHPRAGSSGALSSLRSTAGVEEGGWESDSPSLSSENAGSEATSIHIVEDGDDLWTLASDYGTAVEEIVRTNNFSYVRRLRAGQQLHIPASTAEGNDLLDICHPRIELAALGATQMDWPPVTKQTHSVQPGENLWIIAQRYNVDVPTLFGANEELDGGYIHPGDEIVVPSQKGVLVKVKNEKTLSEIADRYRVPLATVARANHLAHDAQLIPEQEVFVPGGRPLDRGTFIWPLVNFGRISSGFGYRTHPIYRRRLWHSGIDLTAAYGTPIRASRSGRVTSSGWNGGLGNTVIISHDGGFQTLYGHCSQIRVKRNQYVKKGQTIALVGSTGRATGPHLHFEVRKSGRAVNPLRYLPYW